MTTYYYPSIEHSRFLKDSDRSVWTVADDADLSGFQKGKIILAISVGYNGKDTVASAYKLQWRDVTDGGSFTGGGTNGGDVAATGEVKWAASSTVLNDGTTVTGPVGTGKTAKCTAVSGQSWQDLGQENVGDNLCPDVGTLDLGNDSYTEFQWALDLTDAQDNHQYEFRLWNNTSGVTSGTCACKVTVAATLTVANLSHTESLDGGLTLNTFVPPLIVANLSHTQTLQSPTLVVPQVLSADYFNVTEIFNLAVNDLSHTQAAGNVILGLPSETPTLTVADANHTQTVESPGLTPTLTISDCNHAHDLESIAYKIDITVDDASHTQTLETPTLVVPQVLFADYFGITEIFNLTVNDLSHTQTSDNVELPVAATLTVNDLSHTQTLEAPALVLVGTLSVDFFGVTEIFDLVVNDLSHAQTLEAPALGIDLSVADLSHAHQCESPGLKTTLSVADLTHANQIESPSLQIGITPADLNHGQTIESPSLGIGLSVAGLTHAHEVDAPTLGAISISVADLSHAHQIEAPTLQPNITVNGLSHTHSLDAISWAPVLTVADLSHGHNLDSAPLGTITLTGQDANHSQTLESLVLVEVPVTVTLTVAGLANAHALDAPGLGVRLAVQDAAHSQAVESPNLQPTPITNDCSHNQAIDNVDLTEIAAPVTLTVADMAHLSQIESPIIPASFNQTLMVADNYMFQSLQSLVLERVGNVVDITFYRRRRRAA